MNSPDIRIIAEPATTTSCKFTVDRPVYENASFYVPSAEVAESSPLGKRLFALPGVASVLISHDQITVNSAQPIEWQQLGPQIGAAIREHVQSGDPAVSEEARQALPSSEEIRSKIEAILESEINPQVASHGGVVQLIDVKENDVFIRMGGGCQGCGQANVTLKQGVETAIRRIAPEVGAILDTTDHAAGRNPYYASS